jgi:hypothetical protein
MMPTPAEPFLMEQPPMSPTTYFSPEEIHRMTAVYERAVQELNLERSPGHERDRLALYVLSIGNIQDPNRMLDRAVRMYHRVARLDRRTLSLVPLSSIFESFRAAACLIA